MYNFSELKNTKVEILKKPENSEAGAWSTIKSFNVKNYLKESFVFYKNNKSRLQVEILSGLTVVLMQIPDSVAFSFVANV